ncbi:hypothetical protein [Bordetella genomosp. 13]|uniref:hypothetical protein n=1 Tax=Bordetella genomosp. 13 TaxID=463040 RepID=UPI0011AB2A7B|nr:hypothetical protein [Bordetella genomosp. 13]
MSLTSHPKGEYRSAEREGSSPSLTGRRKDGSRRSATRGLWRALAGWSLWALTLTTLYAGHALGCRMAAGGPLLAPLQAPPLAGAVSWGLALVWLSCIVAHVVLTTHSLRRARAAAATGRGGSEAARALTGAAWMMDACATVATVVTGLPVITAAACVP